MENTESQELASQDQPVSETLPVVGRPGVNPLVFLLGIILLAVVGIGGYVLGRMGAPAVTSDLPTPSPAIITSPTPTPSPTISWAESPTKQRADLLAEYVSSDGCATVYVSDLGSLSTTPEVFAAKYYQISSGVVNPEAKYKVQYVFPGHPSITIGPMGMGEVSNSIVGVSGRAISVSAVLNILDGGPTPFSNCVFPESSAETLIESLPLNSFINP